MTINPVKQDMLKIKCLYKIKKQPEGCCLLNGVHEGIRTPDRALRRRMLYPTELRGHNTFLSAK